MNKITEVMCDIVSTDLLTVESIMSEPELVISLFQKMAMTLIETLPLLAQRSACNVLNSIEWVKVIVAAGRKV